MVAITLFYVSWHERRLEQQRFDAMSTRIDAYIGQKRMQLLDILNRRDSYDRTNLADMVAYRADCEEFKRVSEQCSAQRDSLTALYDESDPLREQFWQIWLHREVDLNNEFVKALTAKLH